MSSATPENAYPSPRRDRIQWVRQRITSMVDQSAAAGIPDTQAAALRAAVDKAGGSNASYEAAISRAKTLGLVAREDAAAMDKLARGVIANVRAKANASENPGAVYNLVEVAPARRRPRRGRRPRPRNSSPPSRTTAR